MVRSAFARLLQAGFREDRVCRWFGVPVATDARYVPSTARRSLRKGIGGWIAILVGGELLPDPGILAKEEVDGLVAAGLLERVGDQLRARLAVLPILDLFIASDRIDEAGEHAVVMIDLSALNLARSLPSRIKGRTLDVGCGAGLLTLLCARAGAEAIGSDVDRRSLEAAAFNASLNQLEPGLFVSDLMKQVPSARFDLITFNAPLLRAQLANSDPAAPSSYYTSDRGDDLALEFFAELPARLAGEALIQAQLTPRVNDALEALAKEFQVGAIRFADAPDGTPHAVIVIRRQPNAFLRKLTVSLGPLCTAVDRRIVESLMGSRELTPDRIPLPAPWLELRESRQLDPRAARPWQKKSFGAHVIDDEDLALLQKLDGRPIAQLAAAEVERIENLVALGLIVLE
jgi:SAM-dependent methyltransferase